VRFALALHLGEVLYGNIGGGNRLDFTCIGPAVNLAARLEKLGARLGRTILASEAFAAPCQGELTPIGAFSLAGFSQEQMVYGIAEETGVSPT
jgi:adenylate cyclase